MDEAMHPLTLLAVGLYGKTLPNQNGAPLRLVVPWKYGFKGIKSIVESASRSSSRPPRGTWRTQEYGFYANVNPKVDHPRWSQAANVGSASLRGDTAHVQRLRGARGRSTQAWICARTTEPATAGDDRRLRHVLSGRDDTAGSNRRHLTPGRPSALRAALRRRGRCRLRRARAIHRQADAAENAVPLRSIS